MVPELYISLIACSLVKNILSCEIKFELPHESNKSWLTLVRRAFHQILQATFFFKNSNINLCSRECMFWLTMIVFDCHHECDTFLTLS